MKLHPECLVNTFTGPFHGPDIALKIYHGPFNLALKTLMKEMLLLWLFPMGWNDNLERRSCLFRFPQWVKGSPRGGHQGLAWDWWLSAFISKVLEHLWNMEKSPGILTSSLKRQVARWHLTQTHFYDVHTMWHTWGFYLSVYACMTAWSHLYSARVIHMPNCLRVTGSWDVGGIFVPTHSSVA